jgi:hypothetical protein
MKSREYTGSNKYSQGLPQQNSSTSATKRKDGQMELHEIKKLLHNKRNGLQTEATSHQGGRKYLLAILQTKD